LIVYATFSALTRTADLGGEAPFLVGLSQDERMAMSWVAKATPPEGKFLVVPDSSWETAKTTEWFPYLARRVSLATVQGTEWLKGDAFTAKVDAFHLAMECGYRTAACLDAWQIQTGLQFTHVYIGKSDRGQCCWTLHTSLAADQRYEVVYDGPGATIFAREQETRRTEELVSAEDTVDRPATP
jgi:hypothetical protein